MRNILFSIEVILLFGGIVLCAVGLLWDKIGQLLAFFGTKVYPDIGFKVAMWGFGMLVVGVALLYLLP